MFKDKEIVCVNTEQWNKSNLKRERKLAKEQEHGDDAEKEKENKFNFVSNVRGRTINNS